MAMGFLIGLSACGQSNPSENIGGNAGFQGEGNHEKQELILYSTAWGDLSDLNDIIVAFNKQSDKYYVTLEKNNGIFDIDDQVQKINTRLMSSNAPDIMDMNYGFYAYYRQNNVMVDLIPYLEQTEGLSLDMYLDNAIDAYREGDALYGIPNSMNVMVMLGAEKYVGKRNGWTGEEFLTMVEQYPEMGMGNFGGQGNILEFLMMYNYEWFIDGERGISHLKDEEVKQLLARIHDIPVVRQNQGMECFWDLVDEGVPTLEICTVSNNVSEFVSHKAQYHETMTYKGFPCDTEELVCRMIPGDTFGIPSKSTHKEGAWEFIQFYLKNYTSSYSLPTRKDSLEQQFEALRERQYYLEDDGSYSLDDDGEKMEIPLGRNLYGEAYYAPTEEDLILYRTLIESARAFPAEYELMKTNLILDLLPYFNRQKELDDILDKAHNRIQLFLNETH